MNESQKVFMKTLSNIQETCAQTALNQNDNQALKNKYCNITSDVIKYIDWYDNFKIGSLNVIWEKTGESLTDNLYIELHDMVCNYLKGVDW